MVSDGVLSLVSEPPTDESKAHPLRSLLSY